MTCFVQYVYVMGGSGGVVNSLTFAWHRLSPLAAFTSSGTGSVYFLHNVTMEGGNSEFVNFTLPTLKTFLEARSQNVFGNKQ